MKFYCLNIEKNIIKDIMEKLNYILKKFLIFALYQIPNNINILMKSLLGKLKQLRVYCSYFK